MKIWTNVVMNVSWWFFNRVYSKQNISNKQKIVKIILPSNKNIWSQKKIILPSFLFIFFLKELFYFLWFSEIWNN